MGLDTYAVIPSSDSVAPNEKFKGINLCGGLMSGGNGSSSFRGKVYASIVKEITDVDLYQEKIDNVTVGIMAEKLEAAARTSFSYSTEVRHLAKWFRVAADEGYDIYGWW